MAWVVFLAWQVARNHEQISSHVMRLFPWVLLLMIVNCFPLKGWQSSLFTFDQPVTTAAALVLSPVEAALVSFLGSLDPRELHGEIPLYKTVFNRSQTALHVFAISWGVHHFIHSPTAPSFVFPTALVALALGLTLNYVAITVAISLEHGYAIAQILRHLNLGKPTDYLFTLLAGAFLGAMLAALYERIHPWALLIFAAPVLLGRQVLVRSEMFLEARRALTSRDRAVKELTQRISEERSDERRLIAADLHDEVLQPLFKVTLMAQVIKADLANGRLLDMDEDLPELLGAAELASSILRELIGDLRRSPLGTGGLTSALGHLVNGISQGSGLAVHLHCETVAIDPLSELVIYQIAKEALGNAIQHSRGKSLTLRLEKEAREVRLVVADDGVGFDPLAADEGHYGLHIMRERAASINSRLYIDSVPSQGCSVTLVVPKSEPPKIQLGRE